MLVKKDNFQKKNAVFCLLLALMAFAPYVVTLNADFVHWDDDIYVTSNEKVLKGVTWENVKWAFTTTYFGFYYPVTWLSHMLDVSIYGLKPWGHHLTNILIHLFNSVLLFLFFKRTTQDEAKSFIVAALFAVHPLNVESVAWVSERKNLLAAFFFFLGLNYYFSFVKKPTAINYGKMFVSYILGLMSKSILVTFPLVLCLIDVWPLKRTRFTNDNFLKDVGRLFYDKIALFLFVPIFGYLTVAAQKQMYSVASLDNYPLDQRMVGAVFALVKYICQYFFPIKLSAFYPLIRDNYSGTALFFSFFSLVFGVVLFLIFSKREILYIIAFIWFLINLLPVMGIIQVGVQASADRYMYIPMVGLSIIFVFGLLGLTNKHNFQISIILHGIFIMILFLFAIRSFDRAMVWHNSETLFSDMVKNSSNPAQGYINFGLEAKNKGDHNSATDWFRKALKADPMRGDAYNYLGNALSELKNPREATEAYKKAYEFNPNHPVVICNLAMSEESMGNSGNAKNLYLKAISIDQHHKSSRIRLIALLAKEGRLEEAIRRCDEGDGLDEDDADYARLRCSILIMHSRYEEAKSASEEALKRFPDDPNLFYAYGEACLNLGKYENAERGFSEVIRHRPNSASGYYKMALIMKA